MALVPFSVTGASASQDLDERLMQVGPYSLLLRQRPEASGNTAHLRNRARHQQVAEHEAAARSQGQAQQQQLEQQQPDLSHVGLVLWQSGYVLSDFLLLRLQAVGGAVSSSRGGFAGGNGSWSGVRVLELGCGGGTVGMFLALAGAQVVLTDQQHILPLTQDNLALNFPATAERLGSPSTEHSTREHAGSYMQQQTSDQAPQQPVRHPARDGFSQSPAAPSAAAAFAAAFGAAATPAEKVSPTPTQLQKQQEHPAEELASRVFGTGPLVVQYTWGEPLEQLQGRVAAASQARLHMLAAQDRAAPAQLPQLPGSSLDAAVLAGASKANAPAAISQRPRASVEAGGPPAGPSTGIAGDLDVQSCAQQAEQLAAGGYDVVVGADLLYDVAGHAALRQSLEQLAALSPHLQVFLCWRARGLGEEAFLQAAADAGWVIEELPASLLHPEFQTGFYKLVCMVRLP